MDGCPVGTRRKGPFQSVRTREYRMFLPSPPRRLELQEWCHVNGKEQRLFVFLKVFRINKIAFVYDM